MIIIDLLSSFSVTLEDRLERQCWYQGDSLGVSAVIHQESNDGSLNQHNGNTARLEKYFKDKTDGNSN